MKRRDLIRHLQREGCRIEREGKSHTVYVNPKTGVSASVPRHREINTFTARGVCKDLGVRIPESK